MRFHHHVLNDQFITNTSNPCIVEEKAGEVDDVCRNTVYHISKAMHSGDSSKRYADVRTNAHPVIIRHACDKEEEEEEKKNNVDRSLTFFFLHYRLLIPC